MQRERPALGAGESHGLDDVRRSGRPYDRIGPAPDGAVHAGGVVGVVGSGQGAAQARSQDGEAGHDVTELSCSLDGVFVSVVRRHNPSECQATRQPHSPVPCLVELVGAATTKGAVGTMTTHSEPGPGRPDPSLRAVISERRQLLNLAYRLLGSLADAEDAVQETYARWYAMSHQQREAIESPGGWLMRVAGRICLDLLGSARARRERYVGEWLPEPLPDRREWTSGQPGATVDPADRVTLDESINMAFLVVLDSMTPAERVAFILHDVFGYPFADVAEVVGRTPGACRQLASSARRRIRASQAPATPTARQAGIVRDFKQAWQAKDIDALIGLLDPDATAIADGGGLARALLRPIQGGELIARLFVNVAGRTPSNVTILERTVNGQPGLVVQQDGVTLAVLAFDVAGDWITHIWAVRNPEKLRSWTTG
jgi:RNA polymerase sigma factor (sigma-70 family)